MSGLLDSTGAKRAIAMKLPNQTESENNCLQIELLNDVIKINI